MSKDYLLGIDIGTTGAKANILDLEGQVAGTGYYEYPCFYPRPNWVEQDVDLIVGRSMDATRDAIEDAGIDGAAIRAISFSTQRCCTIAVDENGRLLRPMISWQDNRTPVELDLLRQSVSDEEYYDITRMPMNTTWMASKILWLQENEPEIWARTAKIVQLQDYTLNAWGVDGYYNDFSDAGFSGLWDPYKFQWDETMLAAARIEPERLPQPTASTTLVGKVSHGAAERSGLAVGTPICVGAGDQNSAAVGAGVIRPGTLSVSLGTAGSIAAFLEKEYIDPQRMNMVTNHAVEGQWQLEGYLPGAAGLYRWFRDEVAVLEKTFAAETGQDAYAILDTLVTQVPPGSKGLVLIPHYAGAGSPRWAPHARGTLCGLTFAHDRKCMARAYMEGITLGVKDMLVTLLKSGVEINNVHILGGPTKSATWNQMQADMYGRPVKTLASTDAAPLGAAIMAGVGVGLFKDIPSAVDNVVKIDKIYEPNAETTSIYDEIYDIYDKMQKGLEDSGAFQAIADFQAK